MNDIEALNAALSAGQLTSTTYPYVAVSSVQCYRLLTLLKFFNIGTSKNYIYVEPFFDPESLESTLTGITFDAATFNRLGYVSTNTIKIE